MKKEMHKKATFKVDPISVVKWCVNLWRIFWIFDKYLIKYFLFMNEIRRIAMDMSVCKWIITCIRIEEKPHYT